LAATKSNVNVAMILQFLYSIIAICKSYFKGDFDEKCIKENFVLIYELLDGIFIFKKKYAIMDFLKLLIQSF
jgi:AP-2 complex subunit mu-1